MLKDISKANLNVFYGLNNGMLTFNLSKKYYKAEAMGKQYLEYMFLFFM